uniref:Uncharacterized protein n=1 Tax=CrAss-like virus sp. ctYsL76 TaxID=2826826 RepID=A0A8S5QLH0_9CAUD|nr:MAG TPA: hypothetical protein [CrAss-like virus sp. ctYsL76]
MFKLPYLNICQSLFKLSDQIVTSTDGNFSSWSK